jgi:hypothetical protein
MESIQGMISCDTTKNVFNAQGGQQPIQKRSPEISRQLYGGVILLRPSHRESSEQTFSISKFVDPSKKFVVDRLVSRCLSPWHDLG